MSDVILLDEHRLLCGDATDKKAVDKLLDGEKIGLLLTDPPYGINIVKTKGGGKLEVEEDSQLDHSEREREQWHQLEEQNHQHSGTVGIGAKPGFKVGGQNP